MTGKRLGPVTAVMAVTLGLLGAGAATAARAAEPVPDDPCAALQNKELMLRASPALELKLRARCAERQGQKGLAPAPQVREPNLPTKAPKAAAGPSPAGPFAPPFLVSRGVDRRVSNPFTDGARTTQSETSLVRGPLGTLCAAWNDSGSQPVNGSFSGFGSSQDYGQTWTDGGAFPNGPGPDRNYGDPSLAWSVRDQAFYYAALSDLGLSLWRSNDLCRSFTYVGPIHVGGGDDKELIAIENDPASPRYGRIYISWTNFSLGTDRNQASFSDNGGVTWSAPVSLPGSGTNGQGVWPAVAPNGDVYIALLNRSFAIGGLQDQWIYRSTDGGNSWVKRTDIATGQLRPENVASTINCGRQALNGDVRNLSSPQIAVTRDPSAPAGYVIHATYPYDSDGAGPDNSNVFYRRSVDGAASWSAEVKLNTDLTSTDQWFPALAAAGQGASTTVVVSWYDRRLYPGENLRFDRFSVASFDGGLTWQPNTRISDVSSRVPRLAPNFDGLATCYHGDYDQLAVERGQAYILWSDDRREVTPACPNPSPPNPAGTCPNPDIYFDRINFFQ